MAAFTIATLAGTIGIVSLCLFGLFLGSGGFELVDMKLELRSALLWDGILCLAFFLQHSGMVRRGFRTWLAGTVPVDYHGAIYTIASGAALLVLSLCWQSTQIGVVVTEGALRWFVQGLFLSCFVGVLWGIRSLKNFDVFGAQAVLARLQYEQPRPARLSIRGPYCWVRHPFYFFGIVAIWACPSLTADRILFNLLFTGWIVLGAKLEERDLVAEFGNAYRAYQNTVPMILPWRVPRAIERTSEAAY